MSKVSMPIGNDFCPQTLFLYGTRGADGRADFGLFCWFSYYWDTELGVMMCIGGEKLTLDRIRANRKFSANLVTEKLLPMADYFGNVDGREPGKMDVPVEIESGRVLDVPVLKESPVVFELEAVRSFPMDDGEVFLCKIRNVLVDEALTDDGKSVEERIEQIAPVRTTCETYFGWNGRNMGGWGTPMKAFGK